MIVGTGIDIIDIGRIKNILEKYEKHFISKVLTENEIKMLPTRPTIHIAGRWAAKEATAKALGTGFNFGIGFLDMEITSSPDGKPLLFLMGKAAQRASQLGCKHNHITISHERNFAIAMVILEG